MCYENERQARFETAKYAMKCLRSSRKKYDICLDNEVDLAIKLHNCINGLADDFLKKIPEIFL